MRRKKILPFILFFSLLLLLMSIPSGLRDKIRGIAVAFTAPLWEKTIQVKSYVLGGAPSEAAILAEQERLLLKIENQRLKNEIGQAQELIKEAFHLNDYVHKLGMAEPFQATIKHHLEDLKKIAQLRLEAIPARVIYRTPSIWNSSLWINVGEETNQILGKPVVAKNSPIVVGSSLVGVIDYVGKRQSRVRLITDSGLFPSVRAARGQPQGRWLSENIHTLMDNLVERDDLFASKKEKENFFMKLKSLKKKLLQSSDCSYLAKGEISGSSAPLWRSSGCLLKGIGFNYDFPDSDGPARDLRSGVVYKTGSKEKPQPLLKVHDVLVTTGLDGVFPADLNVAEVIEIFPLREGDYYYELLALPTAGNLDELSLLFVMPPLGYDKTDQPSAFALF